MPRAMDSIENGITPFVEFGDCAVLKRFCFVMTSVPPSPSANPVWNIGQHGAPVFPPSKSNYAIVSPVYGVNAGRLVRGATILSHFVVSAGDWEIGGESARNASIASHVVDKAAAVRFPGCEDAARIDAEVVLDVVQEIGSEFHVVRLR